MQPRLPRPASRRAAWFTAGFVPCLLTCALAATSLLTAHAQENHRGRKYKAPPEVTHLVIHVTRASNGKPVENASVVFHTVENGKDEGNIELKTNEEGQAVLDLIPVGSQVQLQIFKTGYQTYGESFTNDLATREFDIKVRPPSGQFSVYQSQPLQPSNQQSVTPQPTESTAKPAPKAH